MTDNRCPRCLTRAYVRMYVRRKCLACGYEPKHPTPPYSLDPLTNKILNMTIERNVQTWEREQRVRLERERSAAELRLRAAHKRLEERRRKLAGFIADCERLAWSRVRLAKKYGMTRTGISKRLELLRLNNPTARAIWYDQLEADSLKLVSRM